MSAGIWTVKVTDVVSGNTGTLGQSTLLFRGSSGGVTNNRYIYTNEFADYAMLPGRNSLADANGGDDTINAVAVTAASTIDLTNGATSTIAGQSLTIAAGSDIENAIGGDGDDAITGNALANILYGGRGADTLAGGGAGDTLTGGRGDDRFIYAPGGGADTFTDFAAGAGTEDKIDLTAFASIRKLSDVMARATQVGADTVIDLGGGDTITLRNVLRWTISCSRMRTRARLTTTATAATTCSGATTTAKSTSGR